jgi:hypothetical protein
MTKPELKTQADRWRYLLDGGKLQYSKNVIVGMKEGSVFNYCTNKKEFWGFESDSWLPVVEPMSDEFEFMFDLKTDEKVESILEKYIGKRVKIKIEEII